MRKGRRVRTDQIVAELRAETVETFFDLGLLIDRLREDRPVPCAHAAESFGAFRRDLRRGIAFVTFGYGVDGVSMEIAKYARAFEGILPGVSIHYIGGEFTALAGTVIDHEASWHEIELARGFDSWPPYSHFFAHRLERGGPIYNQMIGSFWHDTLLLVGRLGEIVETHDIRLLYLVNTNSNPGNPALALALVLLSEHLGIPVINNCHDFYWEGGHSEVEREVRGIPPGPRDHFFTNAHLGEVFSIIQVLYPWEARSWIDVHINRSQSEVVLERCGHSPANVCEIGTAVDTAQYAPADERRDAEARMQVTDILRGSAPRLETVVASEVLRRGLLDADRRRPLLIGAREGDPVEFSKGNAVLLQPTRIIERKRIEVTLDLIERLFGDPEFSAAFRRDASRRLTLLVTGPVAVGHDGYLETLVHAFADVAQRVDEDLRYRFQLGFLFSEFDRAEFRDRVDRPIQMPDLYNLASVVVLPSDTEGRGLPIIESAACGTPILVRRYAPEAVFAEVIGEHLAPEDRLQLDEFSGSRPGAHALAGIRERILHPNRYEATRRHNRRVVERRFGLDALSGDLDRVLSRLHRQLQPADQSRRVAAAALAGFERRVHKDGRDLGRLVNTQTREYLPGHGRMGFMLMLKSLIDPSFFRVEEQLIRGRAFGFAQALADRWAAGGEAQDGEQIAAFYNAVDGLFLHRGGDASVRFDHSLAYRHRNRRIYPYRDLTPQELTGVIALLARQELGLPVSRPLGPRPSPQRGDWKERIGALCGSDTLSIDDRDRLIRRLGANVPVAVFPGSAVECELETLVLQAVRTRIGLGPDDEITGARIDAAGPIATIRVFQPKRGGVDGVEAGALGAYLADGAGPEWALLTGIGICRVIATDQISTGIDFRQLGGPALRILQKIRDAGGFMVAACEGAAMTTDIAGIERYHIGRADDPVTASILGIPVGSGHVQWVPAGLRATLAHPTPVQTARDLSRTLQGVRFRDACDRLGEGPVLDALRRDAEERGSPVEVVLGRLLGSESSAMDVVEQSAINGVYADGCPWSGVIATVRPGGPPLRYRVLSAASGARTVLELVRAFGREDGAKPEIAWNGGYILNAELVGKLGLPESYIGSPLGLIVANGRVLSPPLFAKPAFMIADDGSLGIRRVSCARGLRVTGLGVSLKLAASSRNPLVPGDAPCFYDLLFPGETLPGDGRVIVRLVGNRIMEVISSKPGDDLPVLPVGLCLSLPHGAVPEGWRPGVELELEVPDLEGVAHGVEAGPMLLEDGRCCIDMEVEGWQTQNSILTQAARLDYLDMRGPKIAIGLDAAGALAVLAVNGRIRESVGATHGDMAEILRGRGMRQAMGFDPGGSSTLVVGDEILNISPYNRDYERNVYAMRPEPRAVANAVVGYLENADDRPTPQRDARR